MICHYQHHLKRIIKLGSFKGSQSSGFYMFWFSSTFALPSPLLHQKKTPSSTIKPSQWTTTEISNDILESVYWPLCVAFCFGRYFTVVRACVRLRCLWSYFTCALCVRDITSIAGDCVWAERVCTIYLLLPLCFFGSPRCKRTPYKEKHVHIPHYFVIIHLIMI